jgi:hypothetical protein
MSGIFVAHHFVELFKIGTCLRRPGRMLWLLALLFYRVYRQMHLYGQISILKQQNTNAYELRHNFH